MKWNEQRKYLQVCILLATLLSRLWLPLGAEQLSRWILGEGSDPVQTACAAFESAVVQGGGMKDGLVAFCDGISGNAAEH